MEPSERKGKPQRNLKVPADSVQEEADVDASGSAQVMYADTPLKISVGPFVSRISFGNQAGTSSKTTSVFDVVLPSNALLNLASQVLGAFGDDPSILERMKREHAKFYELAKKKNWGYFKF